MFASVFCLKSQYFFFIKLRLAVSFCNLNIHFYQNHGFQIGAATTAVARGLSELRIQNMGRWTSNALKNEFEFLP